MQDILILEARIAQLERTVRKQAEQIAKLQGGQDSVVATMVNDTAALQAEALKQRYREHLAAQQLELRQRLAEQVHRTVGVGFNASGLLKGLK